MSKSIGNVIQPSNIIFGGGKEKFNENGFDVCREWVTRESYKQQCRVSLDDLNQATKRVYDVSDHGQSIPLTQVKPMLSR
jgi:isoleucyl-tRNA synthetase